METPGSGEGGDLEHDEVIDVLTPNNKDKDADKDAAADVQRQDVDARRDEPADRSARDDDNQDDDRTDRDRDPPRRRDETDDDYSRRVRGRINRERALRLRSDRRVDELTIANGEMRTRLAKLERTQKAQDITGDATKKLSEINAKIEALKVKMKTALEGGDTAIQLDLNIEMADLIAEKKIIEKRSEFLANEARTAAEAADAGGQDDPNPEQARINRAVAKWRTQNRNWFNLRRFSDVRTDAVELDKQLRHEVSDGKVDMQEYSDEYFVELSARLKELYPDLDVRGLDGERVEAEPDDVDRDARNRDDDRDLERGSRRDRDDRGRDRDTRRVTPRRHAAGNMGSGDRGRGKNDERSLAEKGRVRLTPADHAQMREYGLDPNKPEDKKAFAKERMRTILSEGRETRGGR